MNAISRLASYWWLLVKASAAITAKRYPDAIAIYRQIIALNDVYGGRFQLLIADNDPPPTPIGYSSAIHLDYDHPLVPGVDHPGEGVEQVAGGEEPDQ